VKRQGLFVLPVLHLTFRNIYRSTDR